MSVAVISGSGGLIGSEAALFFGKLGIEIVGIDNDMRHYFFGEDGSTTWNVKRLTHTLHKDYTHLDIDIRDHESILGVMQRYGKSIELIIHAAAQPSHDWAVREPITDFDINARGTLNMLEAARQYCPHATFIFTSTNKVYGDVPNHLPLAELDTRYEIEIDHAYVNGIPEDMSIDNSLHSIFGASKVAADVMVQEYGRYFGMHTVCFRGGTLSGPHHSAAELHGFLAYVMRCTMTGRPYTIFGYDGKQVRDVIHSQDLIRAFHAFFEHPRVAEVYNIGGGRWSNCSVLEAIELCQQIAGCELTWSYTNDNRIGDHKWWISDLEKFQSHYPQWKLDHSVELILKDIYEANQDRWIR